MKTRLESERAAWERRLAAIRRDRRHEVAPLDKDSGEQAIELENDETLDGLDARGHQALEAIDAALVRLDVGTYGQCVVCGEAIPAARLEVQPTAATCVDCKPGDVAR
jgi:RNA polymerase-binding transcription factor DksA